MNSVTNDRPAFFLPANPGGDDIYKTVVSRLVRRACWSGGKIIWFLSFRTQVINAKAVDLPGGFQIACTHISHLEPFLLAVFVLRPIDWITRIEFYQFGWATWFLQRFGAIPVRRQGCSASAIRTAIQRIQQGRIVAIAPEGGVAKGLRSACRGGSIKHGTCLIAMRTGKPIIPCVILGSHTLNAIGPWLPFRRGRLYLAFGEPLYPPAAFACRRKARNEMAGRLQEAFAALYQQSLSTFGLRDEQIP